MRQRLCTALAAAGLAFYSPVVLSFPVWAQSQYSASPPRSAAFDPFDLLDGPPDTPGCIQQCVRDFNPCDPPTLKQTDGRCKHTHGS